MVRVGSGMDEDQLGRSMGGGLEMLQALQNSISIK